MPLRANTTNPVVMSKMKKKKKWKQLNKEKWQWKALREIPKLSIFVNKRKKRKRNIKKKNWLLAKDKWITEWKSICSPHQRMKKTSFSLPKKCFNWKKQQFKIWLIFPNANQGYHFSFKAYPLTPDLSLKQSLKKTRFSADNILSGLLARKQKLYWWWLVKALAFSKTNLLSTDMNKSQAILNLWLRWKAI